MQQQAWYFSFKDTVYSKANLSTKTRFSLTDLCWSCFVFVLKETLARTLQVPDLLRDSCSFCGSQLAIHYLLQHNMYLDAPEQQVEPTKQTRVSALRISQYDCTTLENYGKQRSDHYHCTDPSSFLWVRHIFQGFCTLRTVYLANETHSTGKQLL